MDIATFSHHSNRILVVDDEVLNLEIIAEFLEDDDYELIFAQDGYQAWNILENNQDNIDLVLLDRMMPGLDGLQVLTKMKEHSALKHIPVILQTALTDTQDVIEGMQANAFHYLTKPFDVNLLRSVIRTAINEHRAYISLQNELKKSAGTLSLMRNGIFHFKTLEEAQDLSLFISNACPVPEQAISGLSELMVNAIEHGNLGISYEEKSELISTNLWREEVEHRLSLESNAGKFITLNFQHTNTHINITITDMGEGFNWHDYLEISMERVADNHGRGIAMAKVLSFDTIEYHGRGNTVTATINLVKTDPNKFETQEQLETA